MGWIRRLAPLALLMMMASACDGEPQYKYKATSALKPYCGDGACADNEDCSSCPADCGCPSGTACQDGQCGCLPQCDGAVCGDDGCGGSCGECSDGNFCTEDNCEGGQCSFPEMVGGKCGGGEGQCFEGECCFPDCLGQQCGDNGCGGICGTCAEPKSCSADGLCKCPFEMCSGLCCEDGEVCNKTECCTPTCGDAVCGDDGCGGSCGVCQDKWDCVEGSCQPGLKCIDVSLCLAECSGFGCFQKCREGASDAELAKFDDLDDCVDEHCADCADDTCHEICLATFCADTWDACFTPTKDCPQLIDCLDNCGLFEDQCRWYCLHEASAAALGSFAYLFTCTGDYCQGVLLASCFFETIEDECAFEYGLCEEGCVKQCIGKECGPDGCGGACGDCDDDNPCTMDSCTADSLCSHSPLSGESCDDGDACTANDLCADGLCAPGNLVCELDCTDGQDDDDDELVDCDDPECQGTPECIVCGDNMCTNDESAVSCPQDCVESSPKVGELVINEIMLFSQFAFPEGQYVEVLNISEDTRDLQGTVLMNGAGGSFQLSPDKPLPVGAGELVLLLSDITDQELKELIAGFYSPGAFFVGVPLDQEDGVVSLAFPDGTLLDEVDYGTGWPVDVNSAMELDPTKATATDNDFATAWCKSTTTFTPFSPQAGSPGEPNDACSEEGD